MGKRLRPNLSNFSGGEISPKLYPRVDIPSYFSSCKTLTNFTILPSGSLRKRNGLKFVKNYGTERAVCFPPNYAEINYIHVITSYTGTGYHYVYATDSNTIVETINTINHNYGTAAWYNDRFTFEEMFDASTAANHYFLVNKNNWNAGGYSGTGAIDNMGTAYDTRLIRATLYSSQTTYSTDDVVSVSGIPYKSLIDSNLGNSPSSSPSEWTALVRDGTTNIFEELYPLCTGPPLYQIEKVVSVHKFQNRILYFGTLNRLMTFAGSQSQSPLNFRTNMTTQTADNDPYLFNVFDERGGSKWVAGKDNLYFGTNNGEYRTPGLGGITPSNIAIENISRYGSGDVALQVQDTILFTSKDNKRIFAINYQDSSQEYVAQDISALYEHVFEYEIKYIAYQRLPDAVVWCVLTNGDCYSLSYDRAVGLNAISKLETDGEVDAVTIQDYEDREIVAFIIKRGVNYHLELLNHGDEGLTVYLDSYVRVNMTGITDGTVAGLDHLDGEEVYVCADGYVFGLYTVVSGEVTILDSDGSPYVPDDTYIYTGLPYTAELEPVTIEASGGATLDKRQRIHNTTAYVYETNDLKIADQSEDYQTVRFRETSDDLDEPVPPKTGYYKVDITGSWDPEATIKVKSDLPLPCNIISLIPEVEVD